MIELAVLDIAGTTVQEDGAVYVALEDAVVAAGASPSEADISRWMGADKTEAITALLALQGTTPPQDVVAKTFDDFRARLTAQYRANPPEPVDGVPEALATLRANGVKVALTTGFDRTVTDELLGIIGWQDGVVDTVVCVDDVAAGRPAPYMIFRAMERTGVRSVEKILTAGDTTRDLEAGTNAGAAYVVGVLTGGQSAEQLGAQRHTHILPSVAAIPDVLGIG